jgi:hypothetical protein
MSGLGVIDWSDLQQHPAWHLPPAVYESALHRVSLARSRGPGSAFKGAVAQVASIQVTPTSIPDYVRPDHDA